MSCRIRAEVASEIVGAVCPAIEIFVSCSPALKAALASKWTMMISPPQETILAAGSPVLEVYHLISGSCIVQTDTGVQFDTLEEGAAIGHLDALLGTLYGAHALSKTYCSMYCLSVAEMWHVLMVRLAYKYIHILANLPLCMCLFYQCLSSPVIYHDLHYLLSCL